MFDIDQIKTFLRKQGTNPAEVADLVTRFIMTTNTIRSPAAATVRALFEDLDECLRLISVEMVEEEIEANSAEVDQVEQGNASPT